MDTVFTLDNIELSEDYNICTSLLIENISIKKEEILHSLQLMYNNVKKFTQLQLIEILLKYMFNKKKFNLYLNYKYFS